MHFIFALRNANDLFFWSVCFNYEYHKEIRYAAKINIYNPLHRSYIYLSVQFHNYNNRYLVLEVFHNLLYFLAYSVRFSVHLFISLWLLGVVQAMGVPGASSMSLDWCSSSRRRSLHERN